MVIKVSCLLHVILLAALQYSWWPVEVLCSQSVAVMVALLAEQEDAVSRGWLHWGLIVRLLCRV